MGIGASWLTWYQEFVKGKFREHSSSCTPLFSTLENKLYGYADNSTLVVAVPFAGKIAAVAESPNRDLHSVIKWCKTCGMKFNGVSL